MFDKILTHLNLKSNPRVPIAISTRFPVVYNNFSNLESLYKHNVIVFKCVSTIARSISSIKFYLRDKDGQLNHKYDNLLDYPNVEQCQESFFEELVTVYLLYGSVYCYRSGTNGLMSVKVVKPCDVEPIMNNGKVEYYLYKTAEKAVKIHRDVLTGECDLLHIRGNYMDEENSQYQVIAKSAELYNQIIEQTLKLLQRGCRPSGILYVEQDERIPTSTYKSMIENLEKWLKGDEGDRAFVLSTKYDWKELGLRPSETNFIENKESAAKEIAQAFGVPYVLLSQSEATFANYKEARKHFCEDVILPLAKRLCSELTAWIFQKDGLKLDFSIHMIPALGIANEIQTVNEQRMMYGYTAIEGGDILLRDRN